jgi:hypothetical protein
MADAPENSKYHCDLCQYDCKYPAQWKSHCKSKKHINNGQKPVRIDKKPPQKCTNCEYSTTKTTNMRLHYLNHHATKEERKKEFTSWGYYCEECEYGSFTKSLFEIHINSKHRK